MAPGSKLADPYLCPDSLAPPVIASPLCPRRTSRGAAALGAIWESLGGTEKATVTVFMVVSALLAGEVRVSLGLSRQPEEDRRRAH